MPPLSHRSPRTISARFANHGKEIIKIRSRQHEHTSQCDGPAWLTSERGAVDSWFPFMMD
jgi:hypothetical protein